MRFEVLGPLRVIVEGEDLPLGGPQQRLVLALLIAADGRVLSTDRLIQDVWGEEIPPTARKALQGYIYRLRSQIGEALRTEGAGYSLNTDGDVDAREFVDLHSEASTALETNPKRAAEMLRDALALWKGPAYADVRDELALMPEVARLENLRLLAVGDRIDADLALGRHGSLIGELEGLTLEHPFQERFRAQHMTALYRAGRQTEALRSFERMRRFLAEESGLEPSAELADLEERIIAQDESLFSESVGESADVAAIRGYELRERVSSDSVSETFRAYQRSVGRQVAMRIIGPELANDPEFIANFLADTQRIAEVEHPHISFVFDTWREPGRAYQVSRWLGGGTLEESLRTEPYGVASAIRILDEVGDALAHAHRHGVVHGQVDAPNVLFDESGHAYLSGFAVGVPVDDGFDRDRTDFAVLAHQIIGAGRLPQSVDGKLRVNLEGADVTSGVRSVLEGAFSGDGYSRIEGFLRALRQAAGGDVVASRPDRIPRVEVRNPYKGLQAFQENDAEDFHGRDELIEQLVELIERRRLIAVVGPSGSGKSSVVKAGLIPRLRSESRLRLFTEMYPGAYPHEELEGALLRVGVDRTSLIDDLIGDDRGLLRVLKQILPSDDSELILVIDQFEELFSTVDDESVRRLFLDSLINAISEPRSRLRIVITMRADYFDRPLEYPRFGEYVEAGLVPIRLPDDDRLAQATVLPARSVGVEFEDGLVSRIVQDVSGQPGGLPLLQYSLTELFENRRTNTITLASYESNGGVLGALSRRAEALYRGLKPAEQTALRHALLRMVAVDENADDVRRRVRRSELGAAEIDDQTLDRALQAYAAARLITFDRDPVTRGPTIEVAHEALLREWDRLRDWIEEQRDDLVFRRRLNAAMREWEDSREDPSYLLTGSRLAQFDTWASYTELTLSGAERAYLQASREREEDLARKVAKRRRRVTLALTAAAIVAAAFGVVALLQKGAADENAAAAETERIAAEAAARAESNRRLGLLLAAEAFRRDPSPSNLGALQRVMVRNPDFLGYMASGQSYADVRWIGGDRIVALSPDRLDVYELETRESTLSVPLAVGPYSDDLDRHPGFAVPVEANIAAVETEDSVAIVDLSDGRLTEIRHDHEITSLAMDPSGSLLAIGDAAGRLTLIDVESARGEVVWSIDAHPEETYADSENLSSAGFPELRGLQLDVESWAFAGVTAVTFDPSGDRLASTRGAHVRIWDASSGAQHGGDLNLYPTDLDFEELGPGDLGPGSGPDGFPFFVANELTFADRALIASSPTETARFFPDEGPWPLVRHVPTGKNPSLFEFAGLEARTESEFVYGLEDGRIVHFDYDTGAVLAEFDTQLDRPRNVALSPDRASVVAATETGLAMFSLDGDQLLAAALPGGGNTSLTMNSDGSLLTTSEIFDLESEPAVWDLSGDDPHLIELDGAGPFFTEAARHPDGDLIIQWDPFATTSVFYSASSGEPTGVLLQDSIPHYAFHPDGVQMVYPSSGFGEDLQVLNVVDLQSERSLARIEFDKEGFPDPILKLGEYSPDGTRFAVPVVIAGEGTVHVYETEGWTALDDLVVPNAISVNYGPAGRYLGTLAEDGKINVHDVETHEIITSFAPEETVARNRTAFGPFFSSGGRFILTEENRTLYDISTGTVIGEPFPNDAGSVPYAGDGRELQLVTGVGDHVLIWNLDTSTWFDIACEAAGRNLTLGEWDQFGPNDTEYRATCPQYGLEG